MSGQALVVLLVFVVVSLTITSAATVLILVNSLSASRVEAGIETQALAESGIENALLRLLRNPYYTGESLTVGSGSVTVVVVDGNPKTITSTATDGSFIKKIQATVSNNNNILQVLSWTEIF